MKESKSNFFILVVFTSILALPACKPTSINEPKGPKTSALKKEQDEKPVKEINPKLKKATDMLFAAINTDPVDMMGIDNALMKHPDCVLEENAEGDTALHIAASRKLEEAFLTLVDNKSSLKKTNKQNKTSIEIGEQNQFFDDASYSEEDYTFFLERSVMEDFGSGIDWSVGRGADVYYLDFMTDNTFLHMAAQLGALEAATQIFTHDSSGSLKTAKNKQGKTPVELLPDNADPKLVKLLG